MGSLDGPRLSHRFSDGVRANSMNASGCRQFGVDKSRVCTRGKRSISAHHGELAQVITCAFGFRRLTFAIVRRENAAKLSLLPCVKPARANGPLLRCTSATSAVPTAMSVGCGHHAELQGS